MTLAMVASMPRILTPRAAQVAMHSQESSPINVISYSLLPSCV